MADAVEEKERADGEGKKVVLRVKRKYTEDPVDALCKLISLYYACTIILKFNRVSA